MSSVLKEAERLHRLGFGILWIKPKSKAPVKSKWTTGPRETWDQLKASYKPGYNLGVRLGSPSKVGEKFLAVIDIDVKSADGRHRAEAMAAVKELFPELPERLVQVMSGRGNGSSHLYVLTPSPAAPSKRRVSVDKVRVMMPSARPSEAQRAELSEEDINEGWRIRPAWEVAVMGEGQQVVLPPSLHPDTGREYRWETKISAASDLHVIDLGRKEKADQRSVTNDWTPEVVDVVNSRLDDETVNLILHAETEDRSAALFRVTIAMVKDGWTDRQIMTVLTDDSLELGKVSFEHAKTDSRARAANWIFNYTIKKARKEADASLQFEAEVETIELSDEQAAAQALEIAEAHDWRTRIERNGPQGQNANKPKSTLKNIVLILTNEVAGDVFLRDVFAFRDFYGHSAPWGGKKGELLSDDDALKIKYWLSQRYRFEPNIGLVFEAMTVIAERNAFDPVKDWLESLPPWDSVCRLDTWLRDHFEAKGPDEYLAQVFRKWIVAMVMRVYEPGTKFDWMPIFEGLQGIGKSSFGRLLVGEKYFLDWLPDLGDKDSALSLQGTWAVEMGELANLRKTEIETAKAFITRTVDKMRPPYGKRWIESPRRCVFFGTTNSDAYLRDDSGNRRFKPLEVGQLNFRQLIHDRDQLFAEALFIYKNEFETSATLELEGEAKEFETDIQAKKMVLDEADLMFEEIVAGEANPDSILKRLEDSKVSLMDLFGEQGYLQRWKKDTRNLMFAARALKRLGFVKYSASGSSYWKRLKSR